jgi:hypothetical protein
MLLQLAEVATAEFSPFRWIVLEPLPELGARRDVLEPIVNVEIFLLDATRPESLDQKPCSLILTPYLVCSLNLYHRALLRNQILNSIRRR